MKIEDAFAGVTKVFLDTAPVIYYVEATPAFVNIARSIFTLIQADRIQAVVSPVTLAECLTLPIRLNQLEIQQIFTDLLTNTNGVVMVNIEADIGRIAAELRIQYSLKLPDALQMATAISSGCEAFLTNDIALKKVTELRVLPLVELEL